MKKVLFLFTIFSLLLCGWQSDKPEKRYKDILSIYLVKNSRLYIPSKETILSDLILEDSPILKIDSIKSYSWQSHRIQFSSGVKEDMKKRIPFSRIFVVIANDDRIYWGRFTDPADSYICDDNPAICLPPCRPRFNCIPDELIISRAPKLINNNDIRNDNKIYNVLKGSGKMIP